MGFYILFIVLFFLIGFLSGGDFILSCLDDDIKNGIIKHRDGELYKVTKIDIKTEGTCNKQ